ncbi:probable LRR receptor-like serine/threonine-protein kinase RKF3 [Dioscorea cayenensis subsp. rotundata]|uniref:non-specific serine/threonine protein kinase n=1 Tax=Dioscorea cayennensis subsp. rotundata TaxID=55577 RepID=A0AB40AJ78_DIOCR|nr:probable LRR receptor-like serine/threonine-protein kinase RKF3 [Dioscorea cayenensis subsp. rotundata]
MNHLLLLLHLLLLSSSLNLPPSSSQNTTTTPCPLNFTVLNKFIQEAESSPSSIPTETSAICTYSLHGLHLVEAEYLLTNSRFIPPPSSSLSCWSSYTSLISPLLPSSFNLTSSCGFLPQWISTPSCMNISTLSDFESHVNTSRLQDHSSKCNQSLVPTPSCTACTASVAAVQGTYFPGSSSDTGNITTCSDLVTIYTAAIINRFGPTDDGTVSCLFQLSSTIFSTSSSSSSNSWIYGVAAACLVLLLLFVLGVWFFFRRRRRQRRRRRRKDFVGPGGRSLALESIESSTTLIKFKFDEIRAATKNFSRDYIIGRGGYGNVYKGILADGSDVALKRFKNCSAAGDESFAHEVEVIASVRHVNLVALRGYCIATTPREGHQRIIVCDLMKNGSLHDHLFSRTAERLSWPLRQRIAVGTARGLSYLHSGAQPSIIHRDIKASNILLDLNFEPKVADFGLAKFAPEGMSHVSTRVAGTLGYVAPEYALYGQLTEKSDVYSFGVVLLELLSGRKAFVDNGEGEKSLVTDWAWSLVRNGRTLDVIEDGINEPGPDEVMEKFVLVAVLASHPQLHARPTMDQVVKILESVDVAVPSIPDRPISLIANLDDIERSVSSSGSGQLSSFAGYQAFLSGDSNAQNVDAGDGSDDSDDQTLV